MSEGQDYSTRLELGTSLIRKDMDDGILVVQGVIGEDYAVALGREVRDIIRTRGRAPLKVALFSGGGGVYPAFYLYDTLRNYSEAVGEVTVVVSGIAASAAAGIILQAGDHRQATARTRFMLHEVGTWFTHGTMIASSAAEDSTREMKLLQGMICDILGDKTNRDAEYWQEAVRRRDVWYSADEAIELGLIDSIVANGEGMPTAMGILSHKKWLP